ncbi:MAG: cysteine synthase family protein [Clostridia bacterium]
MSIIDLIGNTPLLQVEQKLFAKLEFFNPSGSIKDRASLFMLKDALSSGVLKLGGTVVEPTSGNTGIGLCMVAKALGLKMICVMPENMSAERIALIKAYGGEVVLTSAKLGMQGAVDKACELTKNLGGFMPNQFSIYSNAKAHIETTAPEIFKQCPNAKWIVAGAGTGGTVVGIKQYIINNNINAKVCAVEPANSPLITKGFAGAHKIQGIGANFIPELLNLDIIDKVVDITDDDAILGANILSKKYGILGGISAGASYMASLQILKETNENVVFIVPDTGLRYLSTGIFE